MMASTKAVKTGAKGADVKYPHGRASAVFRVFALLCVAMSFLFVFVNLINFWREWPGISPFFAYLGLFEADGALSKLGGSAVAISGLQFGVYLAVIAGVVIFVLKTPERGMQVDADRLTALAAYIVRAGFWAVLFVGITDAVISFLRVEGFLVQIIGADWSNSLGRPAFRGAFIHYPLVGLAMVIAYFSKSLGFHWLALLIVIAELQIVIARFIFSYEQAFMADLVRFWYGALFLFASAYTLVEEGHVRVDIFYAAFSERGKAWTNVLGSVLLGMPLCWIIITTGFWGKSNTISGPLLQFEVTQSGYGLYVKYLLAGFLLIFAITMLIQFMSSFLSSAAVLLREPGRHPDLRERANV